jgi:hypothetical protein
MSLPSYLTELSYKEYLDNLYPPVDIDDTLLIKLVTTAYNELNMVYDLKRVSKDIASNCVYIHATHIYRSEGARSSRLDLQTQNVTDAGVVKEKYRKGLPISPFIEETLNPYSRSAALISVQLSRKMEY